MTTPTKPFLCNYTKSVLRAAATELTPPPADPQEETVVDGPDGLVTITPPPPPDHSLPATTTKEYLIDRLNRHPDVAEMVAAVLAAAG